MIGVQKWLKRKAKLTWTLLIFQSLFFAECIVEAKYELIALRGTLAAAESNHQSRSVQIPILVRVTAVRLLAINFLLIYQLLR